MPVIVLHQWEMSPFCNKVRRALRHKGLAFEIVDYNGLLAPRAKKLSAIGTLPVLDYEGERIVDSVAIIRFLETRHPTPRLVPVEPEARAMAHIWEDWAAQSLYFFEIYFRMLVPEARAKAVELVTRGRPAYERPIIAAVLKRRYPAKLRAQGLGRLTLAEAERQLFAHVDALEVILGKRRWLAGDALSVADLAVAAQLDEMIRTSHLAARIQERPRLREWLART